MNKEEQAKIVEAFNYVQASARASQGNADHHDKLKASVELIAGVLNRVMNPPAPKAPKKPENAENAEA